MMGTDMHGTLYGEMTPYLTAVACGNFKMKRNEKSMKKITMAVIGMMLWCVYVPAACSADAEFDVNGKKVTCTVSDVTYYLVGEWNTFKLDYVFCDKYHIKFECRGVPYGGATGCFNRDRSELGKKECDGKQYSIDCSVKNFNLQMGTPNAQKYVCEQQFGLMTIEPVN